MNKIYYLYFLIFNYIIIFLLEMINEVINNIFGTIIMIIILFLILIFNNSNDFFKYQTIKEKKIHIIAENKEYPIILIIKKIFVIFITLLLIKYNFNDLIVMIIIFDYIVKLTLDLSMLEYFLNRKIKLNINKLGE